MPSETKIIIEYFPMFLKTLEKLSKKYPHIKNDLNVIIESFRIGEFPGNRDKDFTYPVYKLRIKNSDQRRGKSGGYRLIYLKRNFNYILLIIIYSKSDQKDLTNSQIKDINKALKYHFIEKGWE